MFPCLQNSDSVQLALELDGSSLEGRKIRVKRSVNKDKLKEKGDGKGGKGAAGKGSAQIPGKGPGTVRGGFKSQKKFARNQPSSNKNFKGEMTDPTKKTKKKGLKKKRVKPRKTVHI